MIEEVVYGLLSADAGLAALVDGRIYPVVLPQKIAFPAVRFIKVSGVPTTTLRGDEGNDNSRFQIDCFAEKYLEAKNVFQAVRAAFENSGLKSTMIMNLDGYEQDTKLHKVVAEFRIWDK